MTSTSGEVPRLEIRALRKYFAASGVLAPLLAAFGQKR